MVLDCIDSWSVHPYLLSYFVNFLRLYPFNTITDWQTFFCKPPADWQNLCKPPADVRLFNQKSDLREMVDD